MYNLLSKILYPSRCPICDKVVKGVTNLICEECYLQLKPIQKNICYQCGKVVEPDEEYCKDCSHVQFSYAEGRSLYEYKNIAKSMYRFKSKGRREYAEFYGKELAKQYKELVKRWNPDAVIPIPIHKNKKNIRGYNQADLIAKVLAKELNLPFYHKLIVRVKETTPQKELNWAGRQNNLKKAFKIRQNDVKLDTIILIDDIYTTGATIEEAARVLKANGTKNIYYLAVGIGQEK